MAQAKTKKIIIIEEGKNKYDTGKMQGAGIKMCILKKQSDINSIKEIQHSEKRPCRCYIIGQKLFVDGVQKDIKKRNLGWKCITNCNSEDDVMKEEHLSFQENVMEKTKKTTESSEVKNRINEFHSEKLSEEEITGVLMAAEELEELKIFPATQENIYNALLKLTMTYIPDEGTAKMAVSHFLKTTAKKC